MVIVSPFNCLNFFVFYTLKIQLSNYNKIYLSSMQTGDPNRQYSDNILALNRVIDYHINTKKYITNIQNIFTAGIFVQCVATGITLCTTGYKMIISNDSRDVMAMASVLSFVLGEFFYFNYYGNEITFYVSFLLFIQLIFIFNWQEKLLKTFHFMYTIQRVNGYNINCIHVIGIILNVHVLNIKIAQNINMHMRKVFL